MSLPKKNLRRRNLLKDKESPISYSSEEAEYLGLPYPEENFLEEDENGEDDLEDEETEDDEDDEDDDDLDDDDLDDEDINEDDLDEDSNAKIKFKKKPVASKERFYVEPKEFDEEIVKFYNSDVISDNLAQMISKIAHKLSYASNFVNYTYREEMVGDGIVRMFKALTTRKYDREKGTNPFSYFTRIAFNAFRNRIKKEKHMKAVHEKYQEELMIFSSNYNNLMKNNQIFIQKDRKYND